MRRAPRQKMDADGRDWTDRKVKVRRILSGFKRRGVGNSIKKRLARQRRREPVRTDDETEQ
jgi:hypothetical protein